MTDIGNTPPIDRPPQAGANPVARSEKSGDEKQQQNESPERQGPQAGHATSEVHGHKNEPALAISPTVARLYVGKRLEGTITAVDSNGQATLKTESATFLIAAGVDFRKGEDVAIRITRLDKSVSGIVISRDSERPQIPPLVELTLVSFVQVEGEIAPKTPPEPIVNYTPANPVTASPEAADGFDRSTFLLSDARLSLPRESSINSTTPVSAYNLAIIQEGSDQPRSTASPPQLPFTSGTATFEAIAAQTSAEQGAHLDGRFVAIGNRALPDNFPSLGERVSIIAVTPGQQVPTGAFEARAQVLDAGSAASLAIPGTGPKVPDGVPSPQFAGEDSVSRLQRQYLATDFGIFTTRGSLQFPSESPVTIGILPQHSARSSRSTNLGGPEPVASPNLGTFEQTSASVNYPPSATPYSPASSSPHIHATAEQANEATKSTHTQDTSVTSGPTSTSVESPAAISPTPSVATAPPQLLSVRSYLSNWPIFSSAKTAVDGVARSVFVPGGDRIPEMTSRLPNTLLFFLNAVSRQSAREWLGETATNTLVQQGKTSLIDRLQEEFSRLGRMFSEAPTGEWRAIPIPMQIGDSVQALALLFRIWDAGDERAHDHQNEGEEAERKGRSRFLLEITLSKLGEIQLEGLLRGNRFDLIVRAHTELGPERQRAIETLYNKALSTNQLEGAVTFAKEEIFQISAGDVLQAQDPILARTVTV